MEGKRVLGKRGAFHGYDHHYDHDHDHHYDDCDEATVWISSLLAL